MSLLALDIGGTAVKYGCFAEENIFGQFSVKDSNGTESLPKKIFDFIAEHQADCIGICAPGPFDFVTGTGLMEHKLPSLYGVSLRKIIENEFPDVMLFFIHDSTAFIFGALENKPNLREENISGIMLGTGLGYIHCVNGKVEVNAGKTPLHPLWNTPYKNGIAEDYVSATAIINKSREKGYSFDNVKDIEIAAKQGDDKLLSVFSKTGTQLGELIEIKRKQDKFEKLVIGGQVSKGWELMREGFEKACDIPYELVAEPAKCPLFGIKYCAEKGIESIYKDGE
ncbi:MAG: ROK family protein [Clostridia bacterium]|nr:ROK family protein [Clostridia bacterium]